MQNLASQNDLQAAADRQVGYVCGAIGVLVSLFMIAVVSGMSLYYQSFYGVLR